MKKLFIILYACLGIGISSNAQYIFPEKFTQCDTQTFFLENDTITARISEQNFTDALYSGFNDQVKAKLKGTLYMQIIAYKDGSSCLLSMKNGTNFSAEELKLKETMDSVLKWESPSKVVTALIKLEFKKGKILSFKRYGYNSYVGMHEITNQLPQHKPIPLIQKNLNTKNNPRVVTDKKTKSIWKLYDTSNSIIPYNMSRAVQVDQNGIVWYCTDRGIVKIDKDNWTIYTAENSPLPANKYGVTTTTKLMLDHKNRVWVESFGDILLFDGTSWAKLDTVNTPLRLVRDLTYDRNNTLWFPTFNGLVKFENGEWEVINTTNSKLPSNDVRRVFFDSKETMWVATESGVAMYQDSQWTIFNTDNSILPSNSISCIKEDKSGNIWIGTNKVKERGGLVKIDPAGNWSVYTTANSPLKSNTIWDIQIDGNAIWLANTSGGLVRVEGDNWEVYDSSNSVVPSNHVSAITVDHEGNKWIATFSGLVFTTR